MFNFTVSVVSIVFAIAGEKNDPVLPAHIFVLCSKILNQQHASVYWTASLRGKTLADMSTPPTLHAQAARLRFKSVSLHSRMLLDRLSPPMKPTSVMMPALAPAVTFCFAFLFCFSFPYVHISFLGR